MKEKHKSCLDCAYTLVTRLQLATVWLLDWRRIFVYVYFNLVPVKVPFHFQPCLCVDYYVCRFLWAAGFTIYCSYLACTSSCEISTSTPLCNPDFDRRRCSSLTRGACNSLPLAPSIFLLHTDSYTGLACFETPMS